MISPFAKKITALLYPAENLDIFLWTKNKIEEIYGKIQRESMHYPFIWTQYYANISPTLNRCFFSFEGLSYTSQIAVWKRQAIALEAESGIHRTVNIDPGYVDGARLVLASTKDHAHRIYLRDGIFAEVTLSRKQKKWISFSYTFPDFKSGEYNEFLDLVSNDWKIEIRTQKESMLSDSPI